MLAYRGGFDGDLSEPSAATSHDAAAMLARPRGARLTDLVLLRFGLHEALRVGKPLQLHVGLGDRDCDLHRTNPMLLLDFLRASGMSRWCCCTAIPTSARPVTWRRPSTTSISTSACRSITSGARAAAFIARTLELAPFRKILYSSDAFGPPELHYLGSALWRKGHRRGASATSSAAANGARPTPSGSPT